MHYVTVYYIWYACIFREDITSLRTSECLSTLSHMVEHSDSEETVQYCLTAMLALTVHTS